MERHAPSEDDRARRAAMRSQDPHHAERVEATLPDGSEVRTKPGVVGFPAAAPAAIAAAKTVRHAVHGAHDPSRVVLDASGTAGSLAAAVADGSAAMDLRVLEPSAAGLLVARESLDGDASVAAGWVWDAAAWSDRVAVVLLAPPADRGTARVHAELAGAAAALDPQGEALLAFHKDRGGKRYLKDAARWFERVEIVARSKGWRVARATVPRRELAFAEFQEGGVSGRGVEMHGVELHDVVADPMATGTSFEAAGETFHALPGVFAAGKIDPGTEVLLAALATHRVFDDLRGRRTLDLGCGYGVLALAAGRAGAVVTALDDDVLAVRSTRRNADRAGVAIDVLHSDLDLNLDAPGAFDVVLCNPPFHVGKQVRLDVSHAFVRAAHRALRPGGTLWLVANRALPYEKYLDGWSEVASVADEGGFKVLQARS